MTAILTDRPAALHRVAAARAIREGHQQGSARYWDMYHRYSGLTDERLIDVIGYDPDCCIADLLAEPAPAGQVDDEPAEYRALAAGSAEWAAWSYGEAGMDRDRWTRAHLIVDGVPACGALPRGGVDAVRWAHETDADTGRCKRCERLA